MNAIAITQNDFLDVLFDQRNKDYGAYALRRQYERRMRNAIGLTALLLVGISSAYALSNVLAKPHLEAMARPVVTETKLIEIPKEETPAVQPPPVTQTAPPAALPAIHDVSPKVVPDNTKDIDPPPTHDELANHAVGTTTTEGDPNGVDVPDFGQKGSAGGVLVETKTATANDAPLTFVEQMPSFPGGEEALAKFLNKNIHYPNMAQENGIQGIVSVQFVVTADGSIQGIKVINAPHGGGLEDEALRVIRKMPNWKPGRQNGRNVAVYFTVPVRFTLAEQ